MQSDYIVLLLLMILSTFVVIFLIKLIYRYNPHYSGHYRKEIVLFHRSKRYKRRVWRFNLIEEVKNIM